MRKLLGALLAIMLLALPALGSEGSNLKITTDCSEAGYFITVTNKGKKDATFFIAIGDGYTEWTLAPGDSNDWKASTGASWVVWMGEGDIIAEGQQELCNSTTTTATTAPGTCYECDDPTSTTVPPDTVPDTTVPDGAQQSTESTTTTEPIEDSATTVAPSTTTSTVPPPTSTTAPAASNHIGPSDTLPFTGLIPNSVDPMILVVGLLALFFLGLIFLAVQEFSDDEEEL